MLIVGIPAFILGPMLWSPTQEVQPTSGQLPFLIFLSAIEALTFGAGIAILVLGTKRVKKYNQSNKGTIPAYIALLWLLLSWWPHDNIHIHNGMNLQGLIYIDYGFHLTLIIASFILTSWFFRTIKTK